MLSPTTDSFRLFLHLVGVTVWIGGQIVLAGIIPTVRPENKELLPKIARRFAQLSWPAFALVVATGVWSLIDINAADQSTSYQITLFVKIFFALGSGTAALIHSLGKGVLAKAIGGSMALLLGLTALFLGVLLKTGS